MKRLRTRRGLYIAGFLLGLGGLYGGLWFYGALPGQNSDSLSQGMRLAESLHDLSEIDDQVLREALYGALRSPTQTFTFAEAELQHRRLLRPQRDLLLLSIGVALSAATSIDRASALLLDKIELGDSSDAQSALGALALAYWLRLQPADHRTGAIWSARVAVWFHDSLPPDSTGRMAIHPWHTIQSSHAGAVCSRLWKRREDRLDSIYLRCYADPSEPRAIDYAGQLLERSASETVRSDAALLLARSASEGATRTLLKSSLDGWLSKPTEARLLHELIKLYPRDARNAGTLGELLTHLRSKQ